MPSLGGEDAVPSLEVEGIISSLGGRVMSSLGGSSLGGYVTSSLGGEDVGVTKVKSSEDPLDELSLAGGVLEIGGA